MIVQRPSVTGIVAWSTARFSEHRLGLLALALAAAIVPVARVVLAPVPRTPLDSVLVWGEQLVLLLSTAAMVLLVIRPPGEPAMDAVREVVDDAPRLVVVKIATAALPWLLSLVLAVAVYGARNGNLAIVIWLLMVPLAFVCQIAFVSATIERTGAIDAIRDAFRRARRSGVPIVLGLSILLALIDRGPVALCTLVANGIFPPPDVPVFFPTFPGITIPHESLPVFTRPGEYASAIPWIAHAVIALANVPFFAFVTVLYTGTALSFADTDPEPSEAEQLVPAPS